jgi:hypothetical protein
MAERAAFYLRKLPTERIAHYRKSKRAYGVRSKVVHGDAVSKGQLKELEDIAIHCDNVARELYRSMIDDSKYKAALDSNKNDELDSFMLNKVFGIDEIID